MRKAQFMCNAQFMRRKAQFIRDAEDVVPYSVTQADCARTVVPCNPLFRILDNSVQKERMYA